MDFDVIVIGSGREENAMTTDLEPREPRSPGAGLLLAPVRGHTLLLSQPATR